MASSIPRPGHVPMPPAGTWAWNAAYTLLAIASDGWLATGSEEVILRRPPIEVADSLRELAKNLKGALPLTGHDRRNVFPKILRGLCLGVDARGITIGDLLRSVADIIEDPRVCQNAFDPIEPVNIVKAEYYEFTRAFGGYGGVKSSSALMAPPLTQALALAGHVYTRIGLSDGTSRHLALSDAEEGISELYHGVQRVLSAYLGGQASRFYMSVLQLLAASRIASRIELSNLLLTRMHARDVFLTANIQGGNRFTVLGLEKLPIAELVFMLREAEEEGEFPIIVFHRAYTALALAGARARCSIKTLRGSRLKVDDAARKILSYLAEYSQLLVLYSITRQRDLAYAAARIARMAHQSGEMSRVRVCIGNCSASGDRCQFTEENSSLAAEEFNVLAELASILQTI